MNRGFFEGLSRIRKITYTTTRHPEKFLPINE
jgi:hypothetical protein